ncbi:hypothetical protein C4D60_Mb11t20340 [Musa balbisiana]|uniref:Uncharacterized protein n=1 Tax=Musa balbisiana TaxID=52838 RepID=A0A4V4H5N9_MUSBA|nr:hypothetical protein C4D60_Mb11t20340 [Musa balbisiana]
MRSEARLDSAVFQLTPTRTRCDLIIIANGKTEKIASGLLNPFLAHLKTAQDQIAKGGYSIILEPDPETDAAWFTKGTVERFVRFVSTPEVLERVTTIESEILQIENAIAIQGNDNLGLSTVEDCQTKSAETTEGTKPSGGPDAGKAIVLFKPASQPNPLDSNGSPAQEENSKVQLLKVLETRKMVLRKEQGMAFARAAAASFDMDNMVDLIPFSENFGASRLKEACLRFMELWKKKHDTGQWLEVEAAEAMSIRSEVSALNASGIIFAADSIMQKDHGDSRSVSGGDIVTGSNGKADKQIPSDSKVPPVHQEHFHGRFQHPTYPQWPMHSPAAPPMFQPYPMQGMPYYQNYPGSMPYYHPPYPPMEDPRFNSSHRKGSKRQSVDNKDTESETWERSTRSQDNSDQITSDLEEEGSHGHKSHKRVGWSGKKKSGVEVIHNINYITSKKHVVGASESDSQSVSESDVGDEDVYSDARERRHKHSVRTSKKEDGRMKSVEYSEASGHDKAAYEEEADSGNWQAFQNFLLRAEEKSRTFDGDMFTGEKEPRSKRKQSKGEADPIVLPERVYGDFHDQRTVGFDSVNGKAIRMKQAASDDQLLVASNGRDSTYNQFKEIESGGGAYLRMSSDEFMIHGQEKLLSFKSPSDPLVDNVDEHDGDAVKSSSYNITDESFLLPYRSGSQDPGSDSIIAIDMDSEFPSSLQKGQDSYDKGKNQLRYEPDDLSLVPERGMESVSIGYDPAMDYEFQSPIENAVKQEASNQEVLSAVTKEESKKLEKGKNLRASNDNMEKRRRDALVKKGTSSRLNQLTEAQKRADKLRSHKIDLQKMKKEREEEERKRLEALKIERQKRIAARSNSAAAKSPSTPQHTKTRSATNPSPSPYRGSKFSDAEPVSSPLRKLPIRNSSNGSNDAQKATQSSRVNGSNHGLTRSASSLPEVRKGSNGLMPEAKTDSIQMKRLSDPESSNTHCASSVRSVTTDQVPKRGIPDDSQKKITAIMQLDKSKSATLPELRIKTPKMSSERVEKETTSKDTLQKGIGSKASQVSDSINRKSTKEKPSSSSDKNPVIEKTVVCLKNNVVTAPVVRESDDMIDTKERSHGDGLGTGYAAIHAPPSPIVIVHSGEGKLNKQLSSYEVVVPYSSNEPQPSNLSATEKPYQAPYARLSSLDDPVTGNLGCEGGVPASVSEVAAVHAASATIHVSSLEISNSGDHTHEKPWSKELKGFRKLLKFGRKSHGLASGDGDLDADASSVDDQTVAAAMSNDGISKRLNLLLQFLVRSPSLRPSVVRTLKRNWQHDKHDERCSRNMEMFRITRLPTSLVVGKKAGAAWDPLFSEKSLPSNKKSGIPVGMEKVKYSREPSNPTKSAKAMGHDLRVHFKNTRETAHAIRKLPLSKAKRYLEDVIAHKQAIPFRRFCGGVGRTAQVKGRHPNGQGRWPAKSARFILDLLKGAESNAEVKGLDVDALFVSHIQVNQAPKQRRRTYRAHGRINPYMSSPCHIELILSEKEEPVKKEPETQIAPSKPKKA